MTLNNADLTVSSTFEDLFYIAPQVINPQAYYKGVYPAGYGTMADFIINNGKLHGRLLGAADMLGYGCNSIQLSRVIMNSRPMLLSMEETIFSTTTKKDVF